MYINKLKIYYIYTHTVITPSLSYDLIPKIHTKTTSTPVVASKYGPKTFATHSNPSNNKIMKHKKKNLVVLALPIL